VWSAGDDIRGFELLAVIADPALDRVLASVPSLRGRGPWKLVRDPGAFPAAWVARRVREAPHWGGLYSELTRADRPDEAWFLSEDRTSMSPLTEPTARVARVQSWDRRTAIVEHDGSCILILRRTHYPGWTYRVDGGAAHPVLKVNGGLQGVPLNGTGTSRVELHYRPTGLGQAAALTLTALAAAVIVVISQGLVVRIKREAASRSR
jgi:hypothetical protein